MTISIDGVEYLGSDEVCALLGVKPATLYAYVSRGRLRSFRRGRSRSRLYPRVDVDALVGLEQAGGAAPRTGSIDLPRADDWMTFTS